MEWLLLWVTIFFSSVIGSFFGGVYLLTQRKGGAGLRTAIPYGPFSCDGCSDILLHGQTMAPIHDTDLAKERWSRQEWAKLRALGEGRKSSSEEKTPAHHPNRARCRDDLIGPSHYGKESKVEGVVDSEAFGRGDLISQKKRLRFENVRFRFDLSRFRNSRSIFMNSLVAERLAVILVSALEERAAKENSLGKSSLERSDRSNHAFLQPTQAQALNLPGMVDQICN